MESIEDDHDDACNAVQKYIYLKVIKAQAATEGKGTYFDCV